MINDVGLQLCSTTFGGSRSHRFISSVSSMPVRQRSAPDARSPLDPIAVASACPVRGHVSSTRTRTCSIDTIFQAASVPVPCRAAHSAFTARAENDRRCDYQRGIQRAAGNLPHTSADCPSRSIARVHSPDRPAWPCTATRERQSSRLMLTDGRKARPEPVATSEYA